MKVTIKLSPELESRFENMDSIDTEEVVLELIALGIEYKERAIVKDTKDVEGSILLKDILKLVNERTTNILDKLDCGGVIRSINDTVVEDTIVEVDEMKAITIINNNDDVYESDDFDDMMK